MERNNREKSAEYSCTFSSFGAIARTGILHTVYAHLSARASARARNCAR